MKLNKEMAIDIFERANKLFLAKQKKLIMSLVSERSWYNHFAKYMEKVIEDLEIEGYYVDTEYNKNDGKIKAILDDELDFSVVNIVCDIIVHSRGENIEQDNLICIEMKKSTATQDAKSNDKKRVRILTKNSFDDVWSYDGKTLPEYVCRYKLGVYYEINIKKQVVYIEYYYKGRKIKDYEVTF